MFKVGNNFGKFSKRGKATDNEIKKKIKELANGVIEDIETYKNEVNELKEMVQVLLSRD